MKLSKIKISTLVCVAYTLVVLLLPMLANAQPDPGDDPDLPIDGGVSLLIAAGVGYGAMKLKQIRNKK